jgi:hypothetical protein
VLKSFPNGKKKKEIEPVYDGERTTPLFRKPSKNCKRQNHFHALRDTCLSDFLYVGLDEEEALVLLATKLTTNGVVALRNAVCFVPNNIVSQTNGVVALRNAVCFVPNNIVSQPRGCAVGLRTALIHQVLSRSQPLPFAILTHI